MADEMNGEREAFVEWVATEFVADHASEGLRASMLESARRAWQSGDDMAVRAFKAGRASLAANAGSEPVAADGWLHENGLLYRLTDERNPCNRDEINVTMADGSRSIESRSRRALELLDRIRATHPSPPEGAGWRPIADAPKDGSYLLLADAEQPYCGLLIGRWKLESWWSKPTPRGNVTVWADATHWMPLPAPPASEAKEL